MSNSKKEKTPEEIAYLKAFGKELQNLIDKAGITQREFASIISIHYNSVNKWVNGVNYPQPLLLKKIIEYFFTNPKIKDFNPYTLLLAGNKPSKSKLDKLIQELKNNFQIEFNLKLEENNKLWKEKYDALQQKHNSTVAHNYELSQQNYNYKQREKDKRDYKELKKELEADRKNFVNQEKERYALTLVKRFGILPESTAKQILREPELQDFIKHLKLANGDGTIKNSYKEFYNNLIEIISEKISRHIANYIKEIYNPED